MCDAPGADRVLRTQDPGRQRPVRRVDNGNGDANGKKRKEPEAAEVEVAEPEEEFQVRFVILRL